MESTVNRILATNLRRRRQQIGLSQDGLAELAGLHRTFIGAVEREEKNVTIRSLEKLAKALDVEPWKMIAPRLGELNV